MFEVAIDRFSLIKTCEQECRYRGGKNPEYNVHFSELFAQNKRAVDLNQASEKLRSC